MANYTELGEEKVEMGMMEGGERKMKEGETWARVK